MPDMKDGNEIKHLIQAVREAYNPPPETPREEMWAAIEKRLPRAEIVDLSATRRRRAFRLGSPIGLAVAAGVVLLFGIGIGRATGPGTAPAGSGGDAQVAGTQASGYRVAEETTVRPGPKEAALRAAALQHLGQTESLLTMVRSEGGAGFLDPQVGAWARTLLVQTRLLMDAHGTGADPSLGRLMEDLELVLAQIVGATDSETTNGSHARTELDLALRGLEEKEMLARIQAVS